MKKIISFEKEIDFPSMIGEVTAISLDNTLKFINQSSANGKFIISGTYKMTEASTIDEEFSYDIPVEVELSEKLDLETVKISIDDFNYSIVNDDMLKCNIDILIEGVEEIEIEEEEDDIDTLDVLKSVDERECDGDKKEDKEIEVVKKETDKKEIEVIDEDNDKKIDNKPMEEKIDSKTSNIISKAKKVITKPVDVAKEIIDEVSEEISDNSTNIGSLFEAFESTEETFTTYSVYILRKEDTLDKILDMYKVTKEELLDYNDLSNLEIGSKIIIPTCNE